MRYNYFMPNTKQMSEDDAEFDMITSNLLSKANESQLDDQRIIVLE